MTAFHKQGQSILEYIITLTVVIAAIAAAAGSIFKPAMQTSVKQLGDTIVSEAKLP